MAVAQRTIVARVNDVPINDDEVVGPQPGRRTGALIFAVIVGALEALLLIWYALSILVFEVLGGTTQGISGSTDSAPLALVVLIVVLGLLAALVTWSVWNHRAAARTPFFLMQAFVVVGAWTLATGDEGWVKLLGIAVIVLAVAAAFVMVTGRVSGRDSQ